MRAPIQLGRQAAPFAPDLATFRLTCEDAVMLVDQLSLAIQQDDEDTDAIPPAYPAQGMEVQGRHERGQARVAGRSSNGAPRLPSYNTTHGEQHRERAPILILEDFEINEGDQAIPFTITDQFGHPTPARYIQVHMTNDPYVVAQLTANGPNYWGKLHTTPYMRMEPVDVLTDEVMHMLEPEFPAADFICNAIRHIGDCTLEADVIRYKAKFVEVEHIQNQWAELERWCYMVGLEMGLCQHRLQDACTVQCIIEEMVQDQRINQHGGTRQQGRHGCGCPA